MPRRMVLELELPDDEAVAHLGDREMALKAKDALVMELLREHEISQGKAAALLGISRHQLFDLMTQYQRIAHEWCQYPFVGLYPT